MEKVKVYCLTGAIMALLTCVLYLMWSYALRSFWVLALIFGAYGFVCFGVTVYKWLQMPVPDFPKHSRKVKSMDETDAMLYENN